MQRRLGGPGVAVCVHTGKAELSVCSVCETEIFQMALKSWGTGQQEELGCCQQQGRRTEEEEQRQQVRSRTHLLRQLYTWATPLEEPPSLGEDLPLFS